MTDFEQRRRDAAAWANQEDAELWRAFSRLYEERRIRWCDSARGWLVSIDHRHMSTASSFDQAIRLAIAVHGPEAAPGTCQTLPSQGARYVFKTHGPPDMQGDTCRTQYGDLATCS